MRHREAIINLLNTPFRYGYGGDCAMGANQYYKDTSGVDHLAVLNPNWTSALEAYRTIRKLGKFEELPSRIGFVEIPILNAFDGDLAVVKTNHRKTHYAYGIINGRQVCCTGNVCYPRDNMVKAYREASI